jgi:CBS domain-containing protein
MRIADILRDKGSAVATVTETTTVTALLAELSIRNIGAMVVVDQDGVVGVVSERDVVRKLHEHGPGLLRRPSPPRRSRDLISNWHSETPIQRGGPKARLSHFRGSTRAPACSAVRPRTAAADRPFDVPDDSRLPDWQTPEQISSADKASAMPVQVCP